MTTPTNFPGLRRVPLYEVRVVDGSSGPYLTLNDTTTN